MQTLNAAPQTYSSLRENRTALRDIVKYGTDDEAKKQADGLLAFMTPIAKAFMT